MFPGESLEAFMMMFSCYCCFDSLKPFHFWTAFPCHRHSEMGSQTCESLHQLPTLPTQTTYLSLLLQFPCLLFCFLSLLDSALSFYRKHYNFLERLFSSRGSSFLMVLYVGYVGSPFRFYTCSHRVASSDWHMVLNHWGCSYK